MGIAEGNSLCSYLYLKQAKMSFFSSTKLENRRAEQVLPWRGVVIPVGWGRWWIKE
jgi:hypothetical protein